MTAGPIRRGADQPAESLRFRVLKRAAHVYWRFARGMTLGVRGVVLDAAGQVFLVRHTYAPGWHFPGGGVEVGETSLSALTRELAEEARVEITGAPVLHGVFLNRSASERDHVLTYVVRDFTVLEPKRPDGEIAEAGFFPVERLPEATTRATRARLDEILSGRPPPPVW
jgi:ADP-ribose pyrophosphatase YjhB (NUDIX family)